MSTTSPTTRSTITATRRSAARTARSRSGRAARRATAAGPAWPRPSAGSTSAGRSGTRCRRSYGDSHLKTADGGDHLSARGGDRAVGPRHARGRVDPHHPRSRGRVRAPGDALLRRQGLGPDAAPGAQGVRAGAGPVPDHARRHRAQLPRGDRVPRPHGRRARAAAGGGLGPGADRRRPDQGRPPAGKPQPPPDRGAAGRDQERRLRRRLRRRPPRRGQGPGQGAGALLPRQFGQWDPKNQRPELWRLYNGRHRKGEHIRVFPISDWTELDVWRYLAREQIELPPIYFAHEREVVEATAC